MDTDEIHLIWDLIIMADFYSNRSQKCDTQFSSKRHRAYRQIKMSTSVIQVICALVVVSIPAHFNCQVIVAQTEQLLTDLFTSYNKIIPPRVDGGGAVEVQMEMFPTSIKEFDEVSETIVYMAGILMTWNDYRLAWNSASYAGIEEITVPVTQVWTPAIIVASSATKEIYVLQSWNQVRINKNGEVIVIQAVLVESSCSMNVKHYPFDTQACDTLLMSLVYMFYEVNVTKRNHGVNLGLYTENSLWDIVSTTVDSELIPTGVQMQIHFIFNLKRKAQYVTVNVLLPIMCLSLLNTLVFLLVPESGERVGYCITTLLAIAVYMTIIMETLPQSSTPVPLISYKLVGDLVSSALIILFVILNLRIHGQSDDKPVPACIQAFYRCLTCTVCKRSAVTDFPNTASNMKDTKVFKVQINVKAPVNVIPNKEHDSPTWQDISFMVDVICFLVFVLVSILSFAVFVAVAKQGD